MMELPLVFDCSSAGILLLICGALFFAAAAEACYIARMLAAVVKEGGESCQPCHPGVPIRLADGRHLSICKHGYATWVTDDSEGQSGS